MKYDNTTMSEALGSFGADYSCPVWVAINDMSGFFASNANVKYGYAAVTNDTLLLVMINLIGADTFRELPIPGIQSVKVKKALLLNSHTVHIKGVDNGKKYYFKITVAGKMPGSNFPDQSANSAGLIERLKSLA